MFHSTTIVRVAITVPCPLGPACDSCDHTFNASSTAIMPLTVEDEKAIRAKLSEQIDFAVAKFFETHKKENI